jgi:glucosyl-3-phosphoglycerate synthase
MALEGGLRRCGPADVYLFADGDLEESAAGLRSLLDAVASGRADMAIADVPAPSGEGFGLVRRISGVLIERMCGAKMQEPLSGQRAVTADCLAGCRPLAPGFGVEVGLTTDAVRMGFTVVEIPVDLRHRATRRDFPGFVHRGRQGIDALRAFVPRALAFR